jgi:hypothetical protein
MTITAQDATDAASDDLILIPVSRWQPALVDFVRQSPLAGCTTLTTLEHGNTTVSTERPVVTFSTGERQVWALLEDLAGGDLRGLLDHADARTLAALGSLFARLAAEAGA